MDAGGQPQELHIYSHLFTVRLWSEEVRQGETEWRGMVQHVVSGQVSYFRDWATMIKLLVTMLPPLTGAPVEAETTTDVTDQR